ncbi:MAG: 4-alpha-glucanotransferase [Christensenellales bacterium]|nr:4-alpha-glucanotransferase [Christensenellales bacterium]
MAREAGILLPIFSLPSKYGIGCFSKEAYDFVDWLADAGQTYWQILPLGPTSYGDSPYQSFSTFAGNPYFIDLEALIGEGVLSREECDAVDFRGKDDDIDYEALYYGRYPLLRKAYERSNINENPHYRQFLQENEWWLSDYALFMALKNFFDGKAWTEWPEDIRLHWGFAIEYYHKELYFDVQFQKYLQFKFFEQWWNLKNYANSRHIRIIGDIPIYVAMDSSDVWAHPELFQLDGNNVPLAVAGCPPDGFSPSGQLWGNPLYRWDYHRSTGYSWWLSRLWYTYRLFDITRIDHFRGFDEYFSIPYGAEDASGGHWEQGPGQDLFRCVEHNLGWHEVIAEDLGFINDSVRALVNNCGFPGMKIIQFAFDSRDTGSANDYLPHNYPVNSVAYTGTHDNETLAGWFDSIPEGDLAIARAYIADTRTGKANLHKQFVNAVMRSVSRICIVPIQDYLGLDNRARTNKPSTLGTNWRWRIKQGLLSDELKDEILSVTQRYGRYNWKLKEE